MKSRFLALAYVAAGSVLLLLHRLSSFKPRQSSPRG